MMTVTDHDPEIMHGLGKFAVDLGPRNCYNCIRCKDIAYGILNKRRFVLIYIYIYINPLRSRSRFLKASLLREISSEITSFRIVKTRENTGRIPPNYVFAHRIRTSNWLVLLDSTKKYGYRYTTARQTRCFNTVDLI